MIQARNLFLFHVFFFNPGVNRSSPKELNTGKTTFEKRKSLTLSTPFYGPRTYPSATTSRPTTSRGYFSLTSYWTRFCGHTTFPTHLLF
jgi:hypothetical protein